MCLLPTSSRSCLVLFSWVQTKECAERWIHYQLSRPTRCSHCHKAEWILWFLILWSEHVVATMDFALLLAVLHRVITLNGIHHPRTRFSLPSRLSPGLVLFQRSVLFQRQQQFILSAFVPFNFQSNVPAPEEPLFPYRTHRVVYELAKVVIIGTKQTCVQKKIEAHDSRRNLFPPIKHSLCCE